MDEYKTLIMPAIFTILGIIAIVIVSALDRRQRRRQGKL